MESDDNSEELEGGIFWKEFQRKMLRCKNFAEIVQIVDSTKIPDISLQRKTTMQPHDRQDQISQFLLPQDVDKNLVPVMCKVMETAFQEPLVIFALALNAGTGKFAAEWS